MNRKPWGAVGAGILLWGGGVDATLIHENNGLVWGVKLNADRHEQHLA